MKLSSNAIGDVGADSLGKRLGENSALISLDLSDNEIGIVGADARARTIHGLIDVVRDSWHFIMLLDISSLTRI